MPTIQFEAEVSLESLLNAIERHGPLELDQIVSEVRALQARRRVPVVPPSGIVSWYKAEDNAHDAVGNNNGTEFATTYGPGMVGRAFQFDGGGYVRVPDAPSLNSAAIAVEAWVKSSSAQGPFRYLVAKGVNGEEAASYALCTGRGRTAGLIFYVYDGAHVAAFSPDAGEGIWDGKWHHVAGTFDGATVRLYVDGKQVGNGMPTALKINYNLPTSNDLYIGTYLWPGGFLGFTGSIDELSIYDRALSASEIQTIYHAGSAGKSNGSAPATPGL
jgi:hypothetical protein